MEDDDIVTYMYALCVPVVAANVLRRWQFRKLALFRVKELKDVLSHLCLSKTGSNQPFAGIVVILVFPFVANEILAYIHTRSSAIYYHSLCDCCRTELTERILALLSNKEASDLKNKLIQKEDLSMLINDIYRKMTITGANGPVTGGGNVWIRKEVIVDQKVRCPCGGSAKTKFMIQIVSAQCSDPQCRIWQHIPCVVIPMELTEGAPPAPSQHYCEVCRIDRCDPSQPLHMEASFRFTRKSVHILKNAGYDVQAWCVLLNDSVPFRMQWPLYSDLKVNGTPVKTIDRPGWKMLGANGRDDGPSISAFLVEGSNKISLSGSDTRTFCFGVRLVKQRTIQEVISFIPSEQEGETFSEAVARVCRCVGRGVAAANDDSSSDLDVIADHLTVNLRCPMSGCRMKTAARFKGCVHLLGFDLHTLVQINQRSRKTYFSGYLHNQGTNFDLITVLDITEIEVKSDGSWRAKIGHPIMELGQWHVSDGSLCKSDSNINCTPNKNYNLTSGIINRSSSSLRYESIIILSDSDEEDDDTVSAKGASIPNESPNGSSSALTNKSSSSLGDQSVIVLIDWDEDNEDTVSATGGSIPGQSPNGCSSSLTQKSSSSVVDHRVIVLSDSDEEDDDSVSATRVSTPGSDSSSR
ncbi:zinc finger, PHD-type [Artemisia annua]|uniref:Zinc finger, PHD-type n=1 Tax=Artemisia annua TaxID=35608 RepID=A0A2U1NKX6_ARTAN|nr:zinc finger, PHD-type [Artemisia annua]